MMMPWSKTTPSKTADDDAETTADDHTLDDGPVETAERSRSRRK